MRPLERSRLPVLLWDFKHGLNFSVQGAVLLSQGGCSQHRSLNMGVNLCATRSEFIICANVAGAL